MLTGKVAMVTGAGLGLGKGISSVLARQGITVVVADVNETLAENCAVELRANGGKAIAVKMDVSKLDDVAATVDKVVAQLGRIDILVNNAGIISVAPVIELKISDWQKLLDVDLTGVLICSQTVAKVMIPQGGGRIINIASVAAHAAVETGAAYHVAKAGVMMLTKIMAAELGRHNILVNSISPGTFPTEMVRKRREEFPESYLRRDKRIPIQRQPVLDDLGNAVLFFADEGSSFITGQDLIVDGGIMCLDPGIVV